MKNLKNILKNLTILYAEDNETIRNNTQKTLELLFARVLVASDGAEAVKLYQQNNIQILLLDYVMPCLDGYEVAKEIRKENKYIPIIVSSGYTDKEKLLKAIEVGIISYVEKPLKYELLIESLQSAVEILEYNNLLYIQLDEHTAYDYLQKEIIKDQNESISLTKLEIDLLECLLKNRKKLVTKDMIAEYVFQDMSIETNSIRNMVYRLRKKIDSNAIITIKDLGYMLN